MHLRDQSVTIYYHVADYATPSWGVGLIYEHVRLLRATGRDARVLHERAPFRPAWTELDVPVSYLDDPAFAPGVSDAVIVPEVLASSEVVRRYPWRRFVFAQGSFLIPRGLGDASGYRELGYEGVMAVLPHVAHVVRRHFDAEATLVPPFVAGHFFEPSSEPRRKRVLFARKRAYDDLGIPDQQIALRLIGSELRRRPDWELLCLEGFDHRTVGALMKASTFLVNLNTHEAFNTTVPEAMASGCIPVCYEATGGRDFLRDGENAIVFANQQVYALIERLCDMLDRFDAIGDELETLRRGGRETASSFSPRRTLEALEGFLAAHRMS
jgi:hypothetical protein